MKKIARLAGFFAGYLIVVEQIWFFTSEDIIWCTFGGMIVYITLLSVAGMVYWYAETVVEKKRTYITKGAKKWKRNEQKDPDICGCVIDMDLIKYGQRIEGTWLYEVPDYKVIERKKDGEKDRTGTSRDS